MPKDLIATQCFKIILNDWGNRSQNVVHRVRVPRKIEPKDVLKHCEFSEKNTYVIRCNFDISIPAYI